MAARLTPVSHTDATVHQRQGDEHAERHAIEVEVRQLRERLALRERVLAQLNRRLLELERGDFSVTSPTYARLQTLRQQLQVATQQIADLESTLADQRSEAARVERELAAMRQTKLFRWSAPLRAVYGLVGRHR